MHDFVVDFPGFWIDDCHSGARNGEEAIPAHPPDTTTFRRDESEVGCAEHASPERPQPGSMDSSASDIHRNADPKMAAVNPQLAPVGRPEVGTRRPLDGIRKPPPVVM